MTVSPRFGILTNAVTAIRRLGSRADTTAPGGATSSARRAQAEHRAWIRTALDDALGTALHDVLADTAAAQQTWPGPTHPATSPATSQGNGQGVPLRSFDLVRHTGHGTQTTPAGRGIELRDGSVVVQHFPHERAEVITAYDINRGGLLPALDLPPDTTLQWNPPGNGTPTLSRIRNFSLVRDTPDATTTVTESADGAVIGRTGAGTEEVGDGIRFLDGAVAWQLHAAPEADFTTGDRVTTEQELTAALGLDADTRIVWDPIITTIPISIRPPTTATHHDVRDDVDYDAGEAQPDVHADIDALTDPDHVDAAGGPETPAHRWADLADELDARITGEPDWPATANALQFVHDQGRNVAAITREVLTRGPLDERPAQDLRYRIAPHLDSPSWNRPEGDLLHPTEQAGRAGSPLAGPAVAAAERAADGRTGSAGVHAARHDPRSVAPATPPGPSPR